MNKWLNKAPRIQRGISWGIPFNKGELQENEVNKLSQIDDSLVQSKVMAYWPDHSIKWTGNAAVFNAKSKLINNEEARLDDSLPDIATDKFNGIYINTDNFEAFFPKHGEGLNIIDWIKVNGSKKVLNVRTILGDDEKKPHFSTVEKVSIEENGPVKAVIKVEGSITKNADCEKKLINFILRFHFFKNTNQIEIIHTIIIINKNEISSLGLTYQLPIQSELWNRQVKFAGDSSIYTEPAQLLLSRRYSAVNPDYQDQVDGKIVHLIKENNQMLENAMQNAIWSNFFLTQSTPDSYSIEKQTSTDYTKIQTGRGTRSLGLIYAGDEFGGVAISMRDFWEKYPAMLEVSNLATNLATMTSWLWSPTESSMDFRHYDGVDHMRSAYEGMEEFRSTPVGIGNTSTLWLNVYDESPSNESLLAVALENKEPALVVREPTEYHDTKALGIWSLPDRTNPTKAFLEDQLDGLFHFYRTEIEQRSWYGFWNYGDVMHTYDSFRHVWRYDMGGYAWQNTELVPNIWLWQYFLRTGDKDVFKMAEAMTRHTSEVDQYHLGEYQGLGSRHNVVHWGCQAKEDRISMAGLHRYYYFLTCDERTRDILEGVKDNEDVFDRLEPLREFYKRTDDTIPIRVGPDWASLTSDWFTEWELTGDESYKNKILSGIKSLEKAPRGILSGPMFQFNPKTQELNNAKYSNVGGFHMIISFGAPQVWMEIAYNIHDEKWDEILADFGRFYTYSDEKMKTDSDNRLQLSNFAWPMFAAGIMANASNYYHDDSLAIKAWEVLLNRSVSGVPLPVKESIKAVNIWKPIKEMPWISTNCVSQWCINIMLCLELIGDKLPDDVYEKGGN